MKNEKFFWGVSTAAAQIEGAYLEDGRTESIWDLAPADKIKNKENCHIACDHYHRYLEDVNLMKEIGVNSYRFSISWSRVIPKQGVINEKGIAFYNNLIDALIEAKIEPIVTLYHWDLPQWAQEKGGWANREMMVFHLVPTTIGSRVFRRPHTAISFRMKDLRRSTLMG